MNEILKLNIEIGLRYHTVLRALRISVVEWDVAMCLYLSTRPISENSLALIIDLPRTTIRDYVEDGIRMGFTVRCEVGLELSRIGRALIDAILVEMWSIIRGDQVGFTESTVNMIAFGQSASVTKKKRTTDLERLKTIGFRPKIMRLSKFDTAKLD